MPGRRSWKRRPSPGAGVDASACDREPIHIPGSIQPALDFCSHATLPDWSRSPAITHEPTFGVPLKQIFGSSLVDLLGTTAGRKLTEELAAQPLETSARSDWQHRA